jgi:predicted thioesterase
MRATARTLEETAMIEPGSTATASLIVTGADLAGVLSHTQEDAFPPVFATSRMLGLMELAAARVMRPVLGAGELSVGVSVEIQHTAATPVGARVDAKATLPADERSNVLKVLRQRVETLDSMAEAMADVRQRLIDRMGEPETPT